MMSTNLGLLQSMSLWMAKVHGEEYHWVGVLYEMLGLPMLDGMKEALLQDVRNRQKQSEKRQSEKAKTQRILWKNARAADREER